MSSRLAVAAGLASGALVAVALLGVLVLVVPDAGSAGPTPVVMPSGLATPPPDGPNRSADASAPPQGASAPPPGATATPGGAFHVGETAPPLSVPQLGGGTIDLAALRGQPVWVNFMATWCPSCVDEFPLMNRYAARHAEDGLVVVAVDVREDEALVASFVQRLGATFPVGLDRDGSAQEDWAAYALPVHFWVDADGVVRDGALGGIGPDVMAAALRRIMPDVEVEP